MVALLNNYFEESNDFQTKLISHLSKFWLEHNKKRRDFYPEKSELFVRTSECTLFVS
jgi:hypothetical protein